MFLYVVIVFLIIIVIELLIYKFIIARSKKVMKAKDIYNDEDLDMYKYINNEIDTSDSTKDINTDEVDTSDSTSNTNTDEVITSDSTSSMSTNDAIASDSISASNTNEVITSDSASSMTINDVVASDSASSMTINDAATSDSASSMSIDGVVMPDSIEGGEKGSKIKILFIGSIPCKTIPKNASWKLYKKGQYEKYNKHYNKYGIREKQTIGVGFTFPFINIYLKKFELNTDPYFVLYKPWADRFKIIPEYKSKIIYTDLSEFGKNIKDEDRIKMNGANLIHIDMRTLEFLLPENEAHKFMTKDPVLKESVYTKSYETKFIKFFGQFLSNDGYIICDECSGLVPYRKPDDKPFKSHPIKINDDMCCTCLDYFDNPIEITDKGEPKRFPAYPKYVNDAFLISRLIYPHVYKKQKCVEALHQ